MLWINTESGCASLYASLTIYQMLEFIITCIPHKKKEQQVEVKGFLQEWSGYRNDWMKKRRDNLSSDNAQSGALPYLWPLMSNPMSLHNCRLYILQFEWCSGMELDSIACWAVWKYIDHIENHPYISCLSVFQTVMTASTQYLQKIFIPWQWSNVLTCRDILGCKQLDTLATEICICYKTP